MSIARYPNGRKLLLIALAILIPGVLAMVGSQESVSKTSQSETPGKQTVRIAVCQIFCIDSDIDGNFRRIEYALEQASQQKAQLACFPETALIGWINPDAHKLATPIPGPLSQRISELARKYKLMICIGISEKVGDKLYDSAILVGSNGEILAKHRKVNTLTELLDPPYTRGTLDEINVVETPLGRVGMLICADTFLDEPVQRAAELKPDLLLVPYGWAADMAAWPRHGESLTTCVTRTARRAGCPVVGTDLVGSISAGPWKGKTYGGQSLVSDKDGKVLGILRDRDAEVRVFEVVVISNTKRKEAQ